MAIWRQHEPSRAMPGTAGALLHQILDRYYKGVELARITANGP